MGCCRVSVAIQLYPRKRNFQKREKRPIWKLNITITHAYTEPLAKEVGQSTSGVVDTNNHRGMTTLIPAASLAARGSGGRSSVSGVTAAVFGSTGFLGRYVVNQLGKVGSNVTAAYRGDELNSRHLRPMGDLGQVLPVPWDLRDVASARDAMAGVDVVVNLMGKHYETPNFSYDSVHRDGAGHLAVLAAEAGVPHFVHVSALGADAPTRSRWLASKGAGEVAVREAFPEATVVRPSTLWGAEDRFLVRMAKEISKLPFVPVTGLGDCRVQPVWVNDVAAVIAAAARDRELYAGKTLELAGPAVMTTEECYNFVVESTKRKPRFVNLPGSRLPELVAFFLNLRLPILNPDPQHSHDLVRLELEEVLLDSNKPDVLRFEHLDAVALPMTSDTGAEVLRAYRKGGDRSSLFYVD